MRASAVRVVAAAVASLGTGVLAATTGHASQAPIRGAMIMTSFVQHDRKDVQRNEMLEFKFSFQVKKPSVDDRTIRVSSVTSNGNKPAVGARITRGNIVRFDPSRSQRNYNESLLPNATVVEKDHCDGFESYQDYTVELPASPELHCVKSKTKTPLQFEFNSTFRTNGTYIDDFPGQPYFVGDHGNGLLGFDPPKSGATGLVDEDAVIILEFSEPINLDTLDPSSSIIVTRITVGEQVPGYVKRDPTSTSCRRYLFIPSVGFGSDIANQQGWDIQVTLTTAITDLAGNALKRPVTFPIFRTRYAPGKPSCSVITESFNNQTLMDPATVGQGGEWNTIEKGALRGGVPTTYLDTDVQYTSLTTGTTVVRTRVTEPLVSAQVPPTGGGGCVSVPSGSRAQMLYVPSDVGIEGAITGVGWGPSSNALFAATHPEIILGLGHTALQTLGNDFTTNVNVGSIQQVYQGKYDVPQRKDIYPPVFDGGYYDWPTFSAPFEWNGVNNLVFDAACAGANNCQILRIAFIPSGIPFPNRRAVSRNYKSTTADFTVDTVVYDIRFHKRRRTTRAISLWYQLASDLPVFATPILSPSAQPGGVSVLVELEGADGKPNPFQPGSFIADPTTGTGFTPVASQIDGHRFFRFRISMVANLTTNQTARITSFQLPYCF